LRLLTGEPRQAKRIDGVNDNLTAQIASARTWALMLNVTTAAAILATMARSFGWL